MNSALSFNALAWLILGAIASNRLSVSVHQEIR